MKREIYGHISKRLMNDLKKTTPDGFDLYAVHMVKEVFYESFQYAGHTFYIHQYKNGQWDVVEKFTGLSACYSNGTGIWPTKEKAVEVAMENFKKYEATGTLTERLNKSYRAWQHVQTSLHKVTTIRLKILKKL